MIEKACSFWIEPADYRCILTHGATDDEGNAFLDSIMAVEAAGKFAGLAGDLGKMIVSRGNHVHEIRADLLSFPIKQYQWSGPDLAIISRSVQQLARIVGDKKTLLPKPEVTDGGPTWEQIAAALAPLPDTVFVVTKG